MSIIRVDLDPAEIARQVRQSLDEQVVKAAAEELYTDLKRPNAYFEDKTGRLRNSIHMYKSRYPDGGYIVTVEHPEAFYIEHGHAKVVWGERIDSHVPGLFFLRRAANRLNQRLNRIIASHTTGLHIGNKSKDW